MECFHNFSGCDPPGNPWVAEPLEITGISTFLALFSCALFFVCYLWWFPGVYRLVVFLGGHSPSFLYMLGLFTTLLGKIFVVIKYLYDDTELFSMTVIRVLGLCAIYCGLMALVSLPLLHFYIPPQCIVTHSCFCCRTLRSVEVHVVFFSLLFFLSFNHTPHS